MNVEPQNGQTARILIIDDEPIFCRGLAEIIGKQPGLEVCAEAQSVEEGLRAITDFEPDLVITELLCQGRTTLDLPQRMEETGLEKKVLFLSRYHEDAVGEPCLRAGATGFVSKRDAPQRVVEAIRHVLADGYFFHRAFMNRILGQLSGRVPPNSLDADERLSPRELEVFMLIGRGATTTEIGRKMDISGKTVETHRQKIKQKLGLRNGSQLAHRAVQWLLLAGELARSPHGPNDDPISPPLVGRQSAAVSSAPFA